MNDGQHSQWNKSLYNELRRLAECAMANERCDHTLQPTALVHEAFLILKGQQNLDLEHRREFIAAAANTIRRILVDHARRRNAAKRGGGAKKSFTLHVSADNSAKHVDVIEIHEALNSLAEHSERASRIVELRFFGGMSGEEIARTLGVSLRTVNNDWKFSKAWLYRKMAEDRQE